MVDISALPDLTEGTATSSDGLVVYDFSAAEGARINELKFSGVAGEVLTGTGNFATPGAVGVLGIISSSDMTGVSAKTIDAAIADVFDLHTIDTNFTITLSNMTDGRTITIFMADSVGHVTWPSGIYWFGGAVPELTALIDVIVLTQISSSRIVGSAALGHTTV